MLNLPYGGNTAPYFAPNQNLTGIQDLSGNSLTQGYNNAYSGGLDAYNNNAAQASMSLQSADLTSAAALNNTAAGADMAVTKQAEELDQAQSAANMSIAKTYISMAQSV